MINPDPAADVPDTGPAGGLCLDGLAERLRRHGLDGASELARSNQGLLVRYVHDGRDLVIKTPTGHSLLWKLRQSTLLGEYRAYRRLAGLPGFPRCFGLIDRRWLVLEFIENTPFRDAELADRERFFTRLLAVIQAMHARGVAHGDLKRKSNLLVDRDGLPVIVDLGTAVRRKPGRRPFNHLAFRFMRQTDLNAWVKLKYGGYAAAGSHDLRLLKRSRIERVLSRLRGRTPD